LTCYCAPSHEFGHRYKCTNVLPRSYRR
jgi:hypothetical protein